METLELSFILFKIDALKDRNILRYVHNKIKEQNLTIKAKFSVDLNGEQVDYMWPLRIFDFVSNYLLKKYMTGHSLLVYVLEGEEALGKTLLIKKEVRAIYQRSRYSNCIHTPSSEDECKLQLLCLQGECVDIPSITPYPSLFLKFPELDIERLTLCANNLYKIILDTNFELEYDAYMKSSDKYYLFLKLDFRFSINEVVSILYENLSVYKYSIEDIYKIAFGAEQIGQYPVISNDNYEEISKIYQSLLLKGLSITVICNLA